MNLKSALPIATVVLGFVALMGGGCATESSSSGSSVSVQKSGSSVLRGTLTYPASVTLPAGSTANVALVRSTYIEETVDVLNSVVINPAGASPISFAIPYDATSIKPGERYSVAARVFSDGKLILRSNAYLVFNLGGPSNDVAISLTPAK